MRRPRTLPALAEPTVTNPFLDEADAERYARGRPFFHLAVLRRLPGPVGPGGTLGLDIGCGTGLSSLALARSCRRVLGVDASRAMIARAIPNDRVVYAVARAERLPAAESTFDVITLGQVAHWIDWAAFLDEARRVARPGGRVVVYDHFLDPDDGGPLSRLLESFYERYPRPGRHAPPLGDAEAWRAAGFHLRHDGRHRTTLRWSQAELIDYLSTQSNVNAARAGGLDTIEGVRGWLEEATGALFATATEVELPFGGPIVCGQREG